jgi:hypothetical protein
MIAERGRHPGQQARAYPPFWRGSLLLGMDDSAAEIWMFCALYVWGWQVDQHPDPPARWRACSR